MPRAKVAGSSADAETSSEKVLDDRSSDDCSSYRWQRIGRKLWRNGVHVRFPDGVHLDRFSIRHWAGVRTVVTGIEGAMPWPFTSGVVMPVVSALVPGLTRPPSMKIQDVAVRAQESVSSWMLMGGFDVPATWQTGGVRGQFPIARLILEVHRILRGVSVLVRVAAE